MNGTTAMSANRISTAYEATPLPMRKTWFRRAALA